MLKKSGSLVPAPLSKSEWSNVKGEINDCRVRFLRNLSRVTIYLPLIAG